MTETRCPNSGALLFKSSIAEKKVERLEEELKQMKELLSAILEKQDVSSDKNA